MEYKIVALIITRMKHDEARSLVCLEITRSEVYEG